MYADGAGASARASTHTRPPAASTRVALPGSDTVCQVAPPSWVAYRTPDAPPGSFATSGPRTTIQPLRVAANRMSPRYAASPGAGTPTQVRPPAWLRNTAGPR